MIASGDHDGMRGHITEKILHETYYDLTERARIDLDFLMLTVSAAVICALGFRMNNAAVIVGAMVISPLLFPVICVAVATYRADWRALTRAAITFAIGILAAIAAAVVVGLFHATDFRSEIVDRISASRTDYFFVAFFSGLAGTYAFFSPKIHEAVAGIAISVALMPPVVMLGIGLGIGIAKEDTNLVFVSGTIVLANVVGIYLGSIVMVAVLHRISRDRVAS
jgi:uncharacterized hydrophobic protein (TIGR00271 family)